MANDKEIVIGRAVDLSTGRQGVVLGRAVDKPRLPQRPEFDDDLRRVVLSQLILIKRRFPEDWRKMLLEVSQRAA